MSNQQSLPMDVHTADYFQKTKVLRSGKAWSARVWGLLFAGLTVFVLVMKAL